MLAILYSAGLNSGYLIAGILVLWGVVVIANRTGVSGQKFTLHDWLDKIDAANDTKAMALVIAGLLIAGALLVAPFIRG
jgi:hypothetical protein